MVIRLLVFLLLLIAYPAFGASMYFDDTGTGTACTEAAPCSLATVNATIQPGDTAYGKAGTYSTTIQPAVSGTAAAPITYKRYGSERPEWDSTVTHMAYLAGRSWIVIDGLATVAYAPNPDADPTVPDASGGTLTTAGMLATRTGEAAIRLSNSHYCTIKNIAMLGSTDDYSGGVVLLENGSSYNTIEGITGDQYRYDCTVDANGDDADNMVSLYTGAHHNRILNCSLYRAPHQSIHFDGSTTVRNIVRGCLVSNFYHSGMAPTKSADWNLIENNVFTNNGLRWSWNECTGASIDRTRVDEQHKAIQFQSRRNIVRRNVFTNDRLNQSGDHSGSLTFDSSTYSTNPNYFYHNTVHQMSHGIYVNRAANQVAIPPLVTGLRVKNNIFWNNDKRKISYNITYNPSGDGTTMVAAPEANYINYFMGNCLYGTGDLLYKNHSVLGDLESGHPTEWASNIATDPGLATTSVSGTPPNMVVGYRPASSSSNVVDAGVWLTTITSNTQGAPGATSITVSDAGYFFDGWGITGETADTIETQNGQSALIVSVDYTTNIITLATPITWTKNEGVGLSYSGDAPDIGAYELETITCPGVPTNLAAGTVTQTTVPLTWTAVAGASGYKIYVEGAYQSTVATNSGTATGLNPGTEYDLQVLAYDADCESALCAAIQATTAAQTLNGMMEEPFDATTAWDVTAGTGTTVEISPAGQLHMVDDDTGTTKLKRDDLGDIPSLPDTYTSTLRMQIVQAPDTYTSSTMVSAFVQNGTVAMTLIWAADGIRVTQPDGSYQLLPDTARYVDSEWHAWKWFVKPGEPALISIYRDETRILADYPAGRLITLDGVAGLQVYGTATDIAEARFDYWNITAGEEPVSTENLIRLVGVSLVGVTIPGNPWRGCPEGPYDFAWDGNHTTVDLGCITDGTATVTPTSEGTFETGEEYGENDRGIHLNAHEEGYRWALGAGDWDESAETVYASVYLEAAPDATLPLLSVKYDTRNYIVLAVTTGRKLSVIYRGTNVEADALSSTNLIASGSWVRVGYSFNQATGKHKVKIGSTWEDEVSATLTAWEAGAAEIAVSENGVRSYTATTGVRVDNVRAVQGYVAEETPSYTPYPLQTFLTAVGGTDSYFTQSNKDDAAKFDVILASRLRLNDLSVVDGKNTVEQIKAAKPSGKDDPKIFGYTYGACAFDRRGQYNYETQSPLVRNNIARLEALSSTLSSHPDGETILDHDADWLLRDQTGEHIHMVDLKYGTGCSVVFPEVCNSPNGTPHKWWYNFKNTDLIAYYVDALEWDFRTWDSGSLGKSLDGIFSDGNPFRWHDATSGVDSDTYGPTDMDFADSSYDTSAGWNTNMVTWIGGIAGGLAALDTPLYMVSNSGNTQLASTRDGWDKLDDAATPPWGVLEETAIVTNGGNDEAYVFDYVRIDNMLTLFSSIANFKILMLGCPTTKLSPTGADNCSTDDDFDGLCTDQMGTPATYWDLFYTHLAAAFLLRSSASPDKLYVSFQQAQTYNTAPENVWASEYTKIDLGLPLEDAHKVTGQGNLYEREYERGYVYYNGDSTTSRTATPAIACKRITHDNVDSDWTGLADISSVVLSPLRGAVLVKTTFF